MFVIVITLFLLIIVSVILEKLKRKPTKLANHRASYDEYYTGKITRQELQRRMNDYGEN